MKQIIHYHAIHQPFKGLFTGPDRAALPPGHWSEISNLRFEDRAMKVRWGTVSVTGSALAAGSFKGRFDGTFNGSDTTLIAWWDGTNTLVYTYSPGTLSLVEITAVSSKYGNSRFTNNAQVTFAVVGLNDGYDAMVIQNGREAARVYAHDGSGYVMTIHQAVTPPVLDPNLRTIPNWDAAFALSDRGPGGITSKDSGGANQTDFDMAATSDGVGGELLTITADATLSTGDYTQVEFNSIIDLSAGKELALVIDTSWADFLNKVKVSISEDGATFHTVHDPTDLQYNPVYVPMPGKTNQLTWVYVVGLSLEHLEAAKRNATLYLRFTYADSVVPTSTQTVKVIMVCSTGNVQGGAQHAVSYYNADSRAESVKFVIPVGDGPELRHILTTTHNDYRHIRIPVTQDLHYRYAVHWANTTSAERDKGVNRLRIYRKDVGAEKFLLAKSVTIAAYSGSWAFSSGSALSVQREYDNVHPASLDVVEAPSDAHCQIPEGRAMCFVGGRLFVASEHAGSTGFQRLNISRLDQPFRFATRPILSDPFAATYVTFDGESIARIIQSSTASIGVSSVFVFTSGGLYVLDGVETAVLSQRRRLARQGTLSPNSVAEHLGAIYWLDSEGQVRRISGGGIENLSRFAIDDRFTRYADWTALSLAFGWIWRDRYYLSYRRTGASANQYALVFNTIMNFWESEDLIPTPCSGEGGGVFVDGGEPKQMLMAADGKLYQYEKYGLATDLAAGVAVSGKTGSFMALGGDAFTSQFTRMLCDKVASGTYNMTTTRRYQPHGGSGTNQQSGVMTIPTGTGTTWITEEALAAPTNEAYGPACEFDFSGTLPGGFSVLCLECPVEKVDAEPLAK